MPVVPTASPITQATQKLERGDFAGAASDFSNIASSLTGAEASRYRVQAALIALDLGKQSPLTILPPETDPALAGLFLGAQALGDNKTADALARLQPLPAAGFDAYQRGLFLRSLGLAQLAQHDAQAAAINLTFAERFPLPANRRAALTHQIWQALNEAGLPNIQTQLKPDAPHGAGWIALLEFAGKPQQGVPEFAARLAAWQSQYPGHPAQVVLVDELLEQVDETPTAITHSQVALLLPFEGSLASVADNIRDGLIAARFEATDGGELPRLLTYHTTAATVNAVFDRAVAEGADLVVGPLEKPAVDVLRTRSDLKVSVLALNATEGSVGTASRFFQFGLRPEDEATDAAERAWNEGHRRIAVIVPNTELGTRLKTAFENHWQTLGGVVQASARFNRDVGSYEKTVQQVFGLSDSAGRASELKRVLRRDIAFDAQRRDDLDAVLMAAMPVDARQILPQFRYFGADAIPVYATSMIHDGGRDTRSDKDLDGVSFGDTAWTLAIGDGALHAASATYWRLNPAQQRFFAFGVDAWRLLSKLEELRSHPELRLAGATGTLGIDAGGVVHRKLVWARFTDGTPRLLDQARP